MTLSNQTNRRAKMIEVYGKRDGFTREEFLAYQSGKHMEITQQYPDFLRHCICGVQNTMILPEDLQAVEGLYTHETAMNKDTVVELYFPSVEEAYKAFREPNYLKYVRPDEQHFSDTEHNWSMVCYENKILGQEDVPQYRKCIIFFSAQNSDYTEWEMKKDSVVASAQNLGAVKIVENIKAEAEYQADNEGIYERALECWLDSDEQLEKIIQNREIISQICDMRTVSHAIILLATDNLAKMKAAGQLL